MKRQDNNLQQIRDNVKAIKNVVADVHKLETPKVSMKKLV